MTETLKRIHSISAKLRALIDRSDRAKAAFDNALTRVGVADRKRISEKRKTDNPKERRINLAEWNAGDADERAFSALVHYTPRNADELVLYLDKVLNNWRVKDAQLTSLQSIAILTRASNALIKACFNEHRIASA
jgi:hypothetical protein